MSVILRANQRHHCLDPAMTCRSEILSIAAIHFHAHSIAVIELKSLKFFAWPAGMQHNQTVRVNGQRI
jgi:hypothetical protein